MDAGHARRSAPRSIVALINAGGGTVRREGAEAIGRTLETEFAARNVRAELHFVEGANCRLVAERALARAKRSEIDAVVVGGGDGTIHTIAGLLAETDIPLGILPLGTLNHFARDIGIPPSLEEAVAVIAAGRSRKVDAGEVNGIVFVNNASIGFFPKIAADREKLRERLGLPKMVAMALAILRIVRYLPVHRLSLSAEGRTVRHRTPCLLVANNAYDFASFGRRERLDRGELWVYVARREGRLAFMGLALRAVFGRVGEADLQVVQTQAAEVGARAHRLLVALDGEVEELRPPLVFRTRPGALRVLVPPVERA